MRWFKKAPPAPAPLYCSVCGLCFKPRPDDPAYGQIQCYPCAKPSIERNNRVNEVLRWARRRWEELEPQAVEDNKRHDEERARAYLDAVAAQQQAMRAGSPYDGLVRPY